MAHDFGMLYPLLVVGCGAVAGLVFLLAVGVTYRRRELPYVLITLSLGALAARSAVAATEIIGLMSFGMHHTVEHVLDGLIAISLLAAIVAMGRPGKARSKSRYHE